MVAHCFSENSQYAFQSRLFAKKFFRTSPSWSTTSQRYCRSPLIFTTSRRGAIAFAATRDSVQRVSCGSRRSFRPEHLPAEADRFVADINDAPLQEILDVAERKRESDVQHDRQTNDLWAGSEVAERTASRRHKWLRRQRVHRKPVFLTSQSTAIRRDPVAPANGTADYRSPRFNLRWIWYGYLPYAYRLS